MRLARIPRYIRLATNLQVGKWYTKDEMLAAGAGGHLSKARLQRIPIDQIDGLEPTPAGDYQPGREITNPVEVVWESDQGKFMLYSGNHRVTQAKMNDDAEILAFVEYPRRARRLFSDVRFPPQAWKRKYDHILALKLWDQVLKILRDESTDPIEVDYDQIASTMKFVEERYQAKQTGRPGIFVRRQGSRLSRVAAGVRAVFQDIPEVGESPPRREYEDESVPLDYWKRDLQTPGDQTIRVEMFREGEDTWSVQFKGKDNYGFMTFLPTEQGGQWEVFNQVFGAIKQFIKEVKPSIIRFKGFTDKQHKLYKVMLKKFFPGQWRESASGYLMVSRPASRLGSSKHKGEEPSHLFVSPNLTGFDGEWGREFDPDDPCIGCVVPTESAKASRRAVLRPGDIPLPTDPVDLPEANTVGKWRDVSLEFSTSDGYEYYVEFEQMDDEEERSSIWEVSFGVENYPSEMYQGYPAGTLVPEARLIPSKHKYEVMQGVAAKIRDFINNWHPDKIAFFPTSKSRRKVYLTMIQRLLPNAQVDDSLSTIEVTL